MPPVVPSPDQLPIFEELVPAVRPRRSRALIITAVILVFGFFALTTFASIYTDRLWYQEVGYGQVFSTMLWTRIGLFLVFGVFMGAMVGLERSILPAMAEREFHLAARAAVLSFIPSS